MSEGPALPHLALIGLRCTGKTSLGRRLAERLERTFVDLDAEVARLGRPAAGGGEVGAREAGRILREEGEGRFRDLEERALAGVLERPAPLVCATGGGVVVRSANRARLRAACRCVWLDADLEVLRARLAADPNARPALRGASAVAELAALDAERRPLYAELAEARFDSGARALDELVEDVARWIASR